MVPSVWTEKRQVESFDVDVKGRLKPHVLFAFLTNSAWNHATSAAHGYEDLSARNQMWVLVKFQLSIKRLPKWRDQIVIETWGKGTERLYALRDFTVHSIEGEKLASATSAWLVLDKDKHRPLRLDRMTFPWEPGRCEMETDLNKVSDLADGQPRAQFRAVFSDIDPNGHVTAMKYLQWVTDSHPRAVLEEKRPSSVEISFLAEAAIDDEVTVYSEQRDRHELCSVMRDGDRKELCRAKIEWT
jgi:acyl-ACP thioesterase